ncbi:citrate/2-methylcitrate synthase [Paenisporosarcina cavernae]|uniref:Citrate synthase n=1 Tax=Paenisporosarcina cavernae TaxID=2320858 RepID=A0A385YWB0_9BACL|nr:citrate/2-methylcitrate synthase [Paenisporosarcina cavernae]AYC30570.1 citrate synthase/methylcitrate synthase [Paenisporosarcina cavernae]
MFVKGLKGVVAVETAIASVDGEKGELRYRGRLLQDVLKEGATFESVAAYLWGSEVDRVKSILRESMEWSEEERAFLLSLPKTISIMDSLRTMMSIQATSSFLKKSLAEQAIFLTAKAAVYVAAIYRMHLGKTIIFPQRDQGFVWNYLNMIHGNEPTAVQVEPLETYMVATMEHGLNASTFAARVTISSESDLPSAVVSALGTMKGPLHGGAPSGVLALLDEISEQGSIEQVIEQKLQQGEKIMGFGHRIYKTEDPRSIILRDTCMRLTSEDMWLKLATQAEKVIIDLLEQHKPGRKLYTNVEFYAAAIMRSTNLPPELFTPTFSVARMVGWTSHGIEQLQDNVIFRPESTYIGKFE